MSCDYFFNEMGSINRLEWKMQKLKIRHAYKIFTSTIKYGLQMQMALTSAASIICGLLLKTQANEGLLPDGLMLAKMFLLGFNHILC